MPALALAGMLGIFAFGPAQTIQAQAGAEASATRSFTPATVAPGGEVVVMITVANLGGVGAVTETLPDGFNYVTSSLDKIQVNQVSGDSSVHPARGRLPSPTPLPRPARRVNTPSPVR